MKIGIINCDLDESKETNGGYLLSNLIRGSEVIDFISNPKIDNIQSYNAFIITGSRANFDDIFIWIEKLKLIILEINKNNIPCLGICFGMQMVADVFGGELLSNKVDEFGYYVIDTFDSKLFDNLGNNLVVYQSHHDIVSKVPPGARIIGKNENSIQAFEFRNFYCVQFHPEISFKIAKIMAERDGDDWDKILNWIGEKYNLSEKIISNFLHLCLE